MKLHVIHHSKTLIGTYTPHGHSNSEDLKFNPNQNLIVPIAPELSQQLTSITPRSGRVSSTAIVGYRGPSYARGLSESCLVGGRQREVLLGLISEQIFPGALK